MRPGLIIIARNTVNVYTESLKDSGEWHKEEEEEFTSETESRIDTPHGIQLEPNFQLQLLPTHGYNLQDDLLGNSSKTIQIQLFHEHFVNLHKT
jgi:hypothetical protein